MQRGSEKDINCPIIQSTFRENDSEAVIFRQETFRDVEQDKMVKKSGGRSAITRMFLVAEHV